jgi:twinkle protein
MGKSSLMNSIIGHTLQRHFPVCVASFETDVKPILRDGLRMAMLRCGKADLQHIDTSQADACMADRLSIISQTVDEDMEMDLDEFLRLASIAVRRHGAKMIVLDPWNELEHKRRRDESETEYIGRALRAIKHFAKTHDAAFWLVAHPTKPHAERRNSAPGLYDISGSANWANKPEYGLSYHRTNFDRNEAEINVTKVRMGLPGKKGTAKVAFDFRTSEFIDLNVGAP